MNKRCIFSLLMVVFLLSTFVIGMAVTANAETLAETDVLVDENLQELAGDPLAWIVGALYLLLVAVVQFVCSVVGAVITAFASVIGFVVGVVLAIVNGVKALL